MTSIDQIAKMANVSKMTVSNVVNKKYSKVSQSTREKIEKIIRETNYTPNLFAKSLKSRESKIVMLAIPQTLENDPYKNKAFNNPFYGEIINSIEYNLRKKGYYLMFRFIKEDESLKKLTINWNIDGVIVIGAVKEEMSTIFNDIEIPSVYLDSYIKDEKINSITIDDEQGGYLATEHLINSGKSKIGFIVSLLDNVGVASKRYDGYKKALSDYKIEFKKERIFEGYTTYEFGKGIGKTIFDNRLNFDALFVYSDIMALSVIKGLKDVGIKVPEDIAVIGFDGLYVGELSDPSLTTIKQDITKKGELAVELLAKIMSKKITEPEKVVMPVTLLIRESS